MYRIFNHVCFFKEIEPNYDENRIVVFLIKNNVSCSFNFSERHVAS
jgi:hypothetical protein